MHSSSSQLCTTWRNSQAVLLAACWSRLGAVPKTLQREACSYTDPALRCLESTHLQPGLGAGIGLVRQRLAEVGSPDEDWLQPESGTHIHTVGTPRRCQHALAGCWHR